jgi:5-methyltetrahydropteroyltriglutamate--homocysteine methyltransferase
VLHSTDRILTSHVGSLLRPVEVMQYVKAKEAREPFNEKAFSAVLDTAVDEVVTEQARVGIDIVSDGEFSRTAFAHYVRDRFTSCLSNRWRFLVNTVGSKLGSINVISRNQR